MLHSIIKGKTNLTHGQFKYLLVPWKLNKASLKSIRIYVACNVCSLWKVEWMRRYTYKRMERNIYLKALTGRAMASFIYCSPIGRDTYR